MLCLLWSCYDCAIFTHILQGCFVDTEVIKWCLGASEVILKDIRKLSAIRPQWANFALQYFNLIDFTYWLILDTKAQNPDSNGSIKNKYVTSVDMQRDPLTVAVTLKLRHVWSFSCCNLEMQHVEWLLFKKNLLLFHWKHESSVVSTKLFSWDVRHFGKYCWCFSEILFKSNHSTCCISRLQQLMTIHVWLIEAEWCIYASVN